MDHLCSNCVFEYHGCGNMSRKNNDSGLTCCQWKHDGSSDKPRTIVPRKTWLDECAMMAMVGIIFNIDRFDLSEYSGKIRNKLSCLSYDLATAMLAEKIKREAKE